MADIEKVFNFKNRYQITNLFNKLNLNSEQLTNFTQIIAEGWDIRETRKKLLDYIVMEDYETYMYVKNLLREAEENNGIGLNQVIELKKLIEDVARKMSDELHTKLADVISGKTSPQISNLFFTYVKDYSTNKDINIDIEQNINGVNFAQAIYNIKNDIKSIVDSVKSEKKAEKPSVAESFKLPVKYSEINKANGKSLESLKESYILGYNQSNDEYYQEMLYEANVKSNTAKLTIEKLNESINNHKRTTLWVNNVGRMTFNPLKEGKWNIEHYENIIRNVSTKRLVEFVNALNFGLIKEAEKKDEKLYDDSMDKFVMDIQDTVDKDQEHRGIKPIKEDEEPDHEVEDWDFYYKGKKIGSSKIDRDLKTGIGKTVSFKDENDNDIEYDDDSRYAQCVWCGDHLPKNEMRKEKKMGWLCYRCARGLESREGKLNFEDDLEEDFIKDLYNPKQRKKHDDWEAAKKAESDLLRWSYHNTKGMPQYKEPNHDKDDEKKVDETTCAGAVASVPQNIFAKPIKRKQATKESKDLQFAKEAANMLDEYCFSLNGKHINYDARDGFNVFVEGVITTVSNKEDFFTLLEMIDNNEDISDYLLEGLSIEDFKFLKEDIDTATNPNEQPLPADDDANAPEQQERTADTGDTAYQDKKNKLQQMADTGVSNITVKQVDAQGNETTNDDYEIQGIEDLDDTGKPSNAIVKNKNTGEMKTIDPHIIDIKS